MEFRLTYRGSLPAETNTPRVKWKRSIRSQLHPQLKALTESHPMLCGPGSMYSGHYYREGAGRAEDVISFWEKSADRHKVISPGNHIHRFAPIVTEDNYNGCSLDILFLRRDMPGGVIRNGGDIDNRLKVLFDALRKPREPQELEDTPQNEAENPCFCLLADDSYIDQVSVTTDRLLSPMGDQEGVHDVVLIIRVVVSLFDRARDVSPI